MNVHTANSGPRYRGMSIGFPPKFCPYIAGKASADDECKCGRGGKPSSRCCAKHAAVCRRVGSEG